PSGWTQADGVLVEDHRVVERERDGTAAGSRRGTRQLFRRRCVRQRVRLARLADIPVLAELARQVAAGRAEGKHGRARQEMVQRLLLDGIDTEPAGASVAGEHHCTVDARAHEAQAALALLHPACPRTQVALDPAVSERMPVAGGDRVYVFLDHGRSGERGPGIYNSARKAEP